MDGVTQSLPLLVEGFLLTLRLLAISGVCAFVLGTLVAAMRISPVPALRMFATVYTEVIRNIPLLLNVFFCGFVLPFLGVRLDFFVLALIGLTVYTSPFVAEAIRSGVNGVALGQAEAARSIGLGFTQTIGLVILPQAIRMVIPPLINVFIALTKNTSVVGTIFVFELFGAAQSATRDFGNAVIPILLTVAAFYLVITVPLGRVAAVIEQKVKVLR